MTRATKQQERYHQHMLGQALGEWLGMENDAAVRAMRELFPDVRLVEYRGERFDGSE